MLCHGKISRTAQFSSHPPCWCLTFVTLLLWQDPVDAVTDSWMRTRGEVWGKAAKSLGSSVNESTLCREDRW